MRTIQVKTGSANYPVLVGSGLLSSLGRKIPKIAGRKSPRVFVLTSPEIWSLWADAFLESFAHDDPPTVLFLQPGEEHKRLRSLERLAEQLAECHADRASLLIAFGGGIIGDVGGFLAAIYMRGIDYIQAPTTLLAQVDSSVGGKTGVNLQRARTWLGAFIIRLRSLPIPMSCRRCRRASLRAGLFESVKAGIIRDAKLFAFMERNVEAVLGRDAKAIEYVVAASVRMKAEVVGIDEKENGLRMILNYGHTLGHAMRPLLATRSCCTGRQWHGA